MEQVSDVLVGEEGEKYPRCVVAKIATGGDTKNVAFMAAEESDDDIVFSDEEDD